MEQDMSRGNPTKLILAFMLPILAGNLFQQCYSMVDTYVVGRFLGVHALAAVGTTGAMAFLILGFVGGLTAGFGVIISQKFGAKDMKGMRKAMAMSIIAAGVLSLVVSILAVGTSRALLRLLATPGDIIDDANRYISIIASGIVATVYYNLLASILRAIGDSRSPLYFLLLASVLNIVGDIVAVIHLKAGIAGVAVATIVSQGISALLCLWYIAKRYPLLHLSPQDWKPDGIMMKKLLAIGLPSALQFSVCAIGVMIVQSCVNVMGSDTVAAYSIGTKIEQMITQPQVTLGLAMATYAGQNLGAGNLERVRIGVGKAMLVNILFSLIALGLLFAFGSWVAELFIDPSETKVMEQTVRYLRIISLFFIPLGCIFIYRNTCQGLGSGLIPMLSSMQELAFRTIVALTLPRLLGYTGICLASPIAWLAAMLLLFFAYRIKMRRLQRLLSKTGLRTA